VNLPTLPPCTFQADSDYISTVTEMSSKGFATRLMVFFIVEHIQFFVFIMTTWWSSIISKNTQKKVQYFHDTQHALLAVRIIFDAVTVHHSRLDRLAVADVNAQCRTSFSQPAQAQGLRLRPWPFVLRGSGESWRPIRKNSVGSA
jgi:hypothetical protein